MFSIRTVDLIKDRFKKRMQQHESSVLAATNAALAAAETKNVKASLKAAGPAGSSGGGKAGKGAKTDGDVKPEPGAAAAGGTSAAASQGKGASAKGAKSKEKPARGANSSSAAKAGKGGKPAGRASSTGVTAAGVGPGAGDAVGQQQQQQQLQSLKQPAPLNLQSALSGSPNIQSPADLISAMQRRVLPGGHPAMGAPSMSPQHSANKRQKVRTAHRIRDD